MNKMVAGLLAVCLELAVLFVVSGEVDYASAVPAFLCNNKRQPVREGVRITKYPGNYACFKFETPENVTIITDPYAMNEVVEPDFVTESHQHADHNDSSKLKGRYQLITAPGTYRGKGVGIYGFSGKHNKSDAGVTNIIFVFEIQGIRIAHFASQGVPPDRETLQKLGRIDVLLIQGFLKANYTWSKLSANECCTVIDQIKPKVVIPEHGAEFIGNDFANHFHEKAEYRKSGTIIITKDFLRRIGKPRIIVLDREEI